MNAQRLSRIAAKYNSPKYDADPQGLYDLLLTAITVEAHGISSRLTIQQDGEIYEYETGQSELHVEERDGSLKIYVPRDKDEQDICFHSTLPRRLLSWMMTAPGSVEPAVPKLDEAASSIISSILNCRISAVPALLKKEGVPAIDVAEIQEELHSRSGPAASWLPVTPIRYGSSNELPSSAVTTPEPPSSLDDLMYATPLTDPDDYIVGHAGDPSARTLAYSERSTSNSEMIQLQYKQLLTTVVTLARRTARRDYGLSDLSDASADLSLQDDVFASMSSWRNFFSTPQDQFFKIGAAGELFVSDQLPLLHQCDSYLTYMGTDFTTCRSSSSFPI